MSNSPGEDGSTAQPEVSSRDMSVPSPSLDMAPPPDGTLSHEESELRPLVEPLVGSDGSTGLMAIVVTPDKTELLALGKKAQNGLPVDKDTVFQIGSVSKPITGFIFASMLRKANPLVALEDSVNSHIHSLSVPDDDMRPVQLKHLASHSGGLVDLPNNLPGPSTSPGRGYTRAMLAQFLSTYQYSWPVGTRYSYSNLGFGLLGIALTDTMGFADYDELLDSEFIRPLGLTRTGIHRTYFLDEIHDNLATGYLTDGVTEVSFAEMGILAPSGEVLSSGEDVARMLRVLVGIDPFPIEGAVEQSLEPLGPGAGELDIGFGWDITRTNPTIWSKSGLTPGFTAFVAFKRSPQVGVAILSNRGRHMAIKSAAFELLELVSE